MINNTAAKLPWSNHENIKLFESELISTRRFGIETLVKDVYNTDFFYSHCSGHDHIPGGTLNHSLWVLWAARLLVSKSPGRYQDITDNQLVIVCLLHDLGNMSGHGSGHGKKAADFIHSIQNDIDLDISKEELSAIRFHRGHRITNDFDKELYKYYNNPLRRILQKADGIAAGMFNCIAFGKAPESFMTEYRPNSAFCRYLPATKHWYIDLIGFKKYPTRTGPVSATGFTNEKDVTRIWGVNLYQFAIFSEDIMICNDESGKMAVFTPVTVGQNGCELYQSDRGGFCYTRVIAYLNRYGRDLTHGSPHFLVTATPRGWAVIKIKMSHSTIFVEREFMVKNATSEADALEQLRSLRHGVDLRVSDIYQRISVPEDITAVDDTLSKLV